MSLRCTKLGVANFRAFGPGKDVSGAPPNDPSIQYVDVNQDIVVLLGNNNSGKSTLLHAYDVVRAAKRKLDLDDFHQHDVSVPVLIEVWLEADEDEDKPANTQKWFDADNTARIRKVWVGAATESEKYSFDFNSQTWEKGGFGGWDTILQSQMPRPIWIKAIMSEEEILGEIRKLVAEVVLAKVRSATEFQAAEAAIEALSALIENDTFLDTFASSVTDAVAKVFPDTKVNVSNPASAKGVMSLFEKQAQIELTVKNAPRLAFGRHGHGLQRQCALSILRLAATEIAAAEKADSGKKGATPESAQRVLLIEEPELFLEPSAVRGVRDSLYDLAATERFQVIAATHSPLLVDLARPRQTLARVWRSAAGSSIFQIPDLNPTWDQRLALQQRRALDPYYNEAFFHNFVIICEGDSETLALDKIFQRQNVDRNHFYLLNAGGNQEVPFYQNVCLRFGIPHAVIYDLDRRFDGAKERTAWGIHKRIADQLQIATSSGIAANIFVQVRDFETAHGIVGADKKKEAVAFATSVDVSPVSASPIVQFSHLCTSGGTWPPSSIGDLETLDANSP